MRGIPSSYLIIFYLVVTLIELLSYFGIRKLINQLNIGYRRIWLFVYLAFSLIAVSVLFYSFSNPELIRNTQNYLFFYVVITVGYLNLMPKFIWAIAVILSQILGFVRQSRIQMLILAGTALLSLGLFLSIGFGILFGRNAIRTENIDLYFHDLPVQLADLKIVQLSDIHLGSMNQNLELLEHTAHIIQKINPDLLLFTGDLVNNFSSEILGYESCLRKLPGKLGKYAIQGNHDYGDYSNWTDSIAKQQNLAQIRRGMNQCGFKLLLNQWVSVRVKDTSFVLIGVENWGHKPFKQYANLDKALEGVPANAFKILMSHDPAHWNSMVVPYTDIPLTLSGHTHGGQFAVKIAGIEFSPIYFIQKHWGGLYRVDNQYLYVNRGLGTIGFLGRIDMRPEITVITLHRTKNH